jgi:chromosome segregation ATPase
MAAKKAARPSRPRASAASSAPAGQLKQLRSKVQELRQKLTQAAHKRQLDVRVITEAKRARDQVSKQMRMLRDQGRKLAVDLKSALSESDRRHKAREQALAKIAELKAELSSKTQELRRKSHELAQLARESAARAQAIIEEPAPAPQTTAAEEAASSSEAIGPSQTENSPDQLPWEKGL